MIKTDYLHVEIDEEADEIEFKSYVLLIGYSRSIGICGLLWNHVEVGDACNYEAIRYTIQQHNVLKHVHTSKRVQIGGRDMLWGYLYAS